VFQIGRKLKFVVFQLGRMDCIFFYHLYSVTSDTVEEGNMRHLKFSPKVLHILFLSIVSLENVGDFYSACWNPTNFVSVIVLGIIKGKVA
jgi:hypothetical protein